MKALALVLLAAGAAWVGGYGYGRWYLKPDASARTVLYWVDPMHPWYKASKPGIAPDCGMTLVAVHSGEESKYSQSENPGLAPGAIAITPEKRQLIGVESAPVGFAVMSGSLRAAGRVMIDETRISKVQSRIEGWIDKVFVDFTGKSVRKGDPLLSIYSPEALATQQEYLLALRAAKLAESNPMHEMMANTGRMVEAARRRLELWDISAAQIDEVARTGKPIQNLTLYAPSSGVVAERSGFKGQRVTTETPLYTLADLSTVWVQADIYEYESAQVHLGQAASFTLSSLPGRAFHGRVAFILPQVDPTTRTLKARIELANPGLALKPDMYGEVELATGSNRSMVVPRSAVLDSGDRKTVFLDKGNGIFEPRAVHTGRESDGNVEVLDGLAAGDRVVVSGNFLLDSESQLKAPSGGGAK